VDESGPDLQIRPPTVEEFKRFQKRPLVLLHDISSESYSCSTLSSH
jgi:hypothetical protein